MSDNQVAPRRFSFSHVTIRPVADVDIQYDVNRPDVVMILMGPTGAGKSRFVEALAGDVTMGISKDQLDSVTHSIATYEVVPGAIWHGPGTAVTQVEQQPDHSKIYLLDTPGFSDGQISEVEIIEMVREWMKAHKCTKIEQILYMFPITDIRLAGTKRRTIGMLKSFSGLHDEEPGELAVITTMWDRLWNERMRKAAETRYEELKADIWKDLLDVGGYFTKFMNTRESAVAIMDLLYEAYHVSLSRSRYAAYCLELEPTELRDAQFISPLYQDLLDRLQNARQQKHVLEMELRRPETQGNYALKSFMEERFGMNEVLLNKFETQLIQLGDPPQGFEEYIPIRDAIVAQHRLRDTQAAAGPPWSRGGQPNFSSPSRISKFKNLFQNPIRVVKKGLRK